jgi:hypothetical protein
MIRASAATATGAAQGIHPAATRALSELIESGLDSQIGQ